MKYPQINKTTNVKNYMIPNFKTIWKDTKMNLNEWEAP